MGFAEKRCLDEVKQQCDQNKVRYYELEEEE